VQRTAAIVWVEIIFLIGVAVLTLAVLPRQGFDAVRSVSWYYICSLAVIIVCHILYIVRLAPRTWLRSFLTSTPIIALACTPWLAQARYGVFDFSRLRDGHGLFSAILLAIGLSFIDFVIIVFVDARATARAGS
jgi:hypothetical protein